VSLVANNLGVLMEDLGRADDAFEAYSRARELLPQNASALINQFTMMRMGYAITQSNALQVSAEQLGKTLAPGLRKIGALSRYYGEVRSPGAFAGLGWEWIGVGDGDLAASNLQRAMGLLPEDGRDAVKQRLASLYLMGDQNTESQALFYELLVENPRNAGALLGMARIELAGGNFERAADYLRRAAKANAPQSLMDMEWAAYYIAKGDVEEAQRLLNDVLREHPRLERAWAMLISIAIQEADETALEACVRNLQRLGGDNAFLQAVATGYLAALRGDIIAATNAFEEALRVDPSSTMAIDMLVRFALARNDGSAAERWARRLLRLDADHPLANRIVAMRQMERKEYDLAVDSLRRSLKGEEDPRALNNLAWLLQESGLNSEAEAHVRQALELKPDLNSAWDTLGVILMKTERFDEAAQAFGKCIELAPDGALAKLHLAQLDLATDEPATVRRVVDELTPRKGELTVEEADLLDEITRRLNR
jgi:Tfp pilus assembly protein PilF